MIDLENLTCYVDLHSHLDGAISVENAKHLAAMQGIAIPESDAEIGKLLRVSEDCHDLNEFLEKFAFPCSLLMTRAGLTEATKTLLAELFADGMMYTELRFAPQLSVGDDLTQEDAVCAVLAGIEESELPAKLILCCMRGNDNREANLETVEVAAKYLGRGVAALDLAGAEALFPTENFAEVFALARERRVPFTIHAGEAAGPESIAAALDFGACRIGHGVRCLEDENVVMRIAGQIISGQEISGQKISDQKISDQKISDQKCLGQKIPLECCPTSNVQTCIFPSIREFPLAKLREKGVVVTINTDDMSVCGTTIKGEWRKLIETFSLSDADVRELMVNSVEASFADAEQKEKMRAEILRQIP